MSSAMIYILHREYDIVKVKRGGIDMYPYGCSYPGYPPYGGYYGGGCSWIIAVLVIIFIVFFIARPWYGPKPC